MLHTFHHTRLLMKHLSARRPAMILWLILMLLIRPPARTEAVQPNGQPRISTVTPCPTSPGPAPVITHGHPARPRIALTFDADAFNAGTAEILTALGQRGAKATFFLTGTWMRNNPDFVRQMIADGHQVVTHANTHVDFRTLNDQAMREQLQAGEQELARFGVRGWPYIRLPSDAFNQRVLQVLCSQGYTYIFWALDARDAVGQPKSAAYVEDRVLNGLPPEQRNGAIILLHLGKPGTTTALPRILDRLSAQGFEMVSVQELLHLPIPAPARGSCRRCV